MNTKDALLPYRYQRVKGIFEENMENIMGTNRIFSQDTIILHAALASLNCADVAYVAALTTLHYTRICMLALWIHSLLPHRKNTRVLIKK